MSIIYRPLRESDYAILAELLNDSSVVDGRAQRQVADELREEFESHPVSLDNHTLAAWNDGQLIGVIYAYYLPSEVREVRCYLFGTVAPSFRGRGIGRHLLAWGEHTAAGLLRSSPSDLPRYVRVDTPRANTSAIRLYERAGLAPIRYFADLRLRLAQSAAPVATGTTGVRIVPWDLARNHEALTVKNSAFEDHWGSTPMTPEWWESKTSGFGSRADWSYFALNDADEIVGFLLTHRYEADDELLGGTYAWVDNIGTLKHWRGRGVATSLLTTAIARYRSEGLDFAALGVDSDNPTGAYRLYESVGFAPWRHTVTYQRVIGA